MLLDLGFVHFDLCAGGVSSYPHRDNFKNPFTSELAY